MVIDVLGTTIAVRAPDPVLGDVHRLVADLQVDRPAARDLLVERDGDDALRLLDDGTVVRSGIAPAVGAATVVWWLNVIATTTAPHVLLHAGCVGDRGAVALPGASGAGKSTLVAACVADGLAYLSDEYAAIDPSTGTVSPYARPIELDRGLVAASTLGAALAGPLAPTGIVFPRYDPHAPPSTVPLEPRATFLALVGHAANLGRRGGEAVPWLAALAETCPAWETTYRDGREAVALVRDLAGRTGVPLRPAPPVGPVTTTTTTVVIDGDTAVFDTVTGRIHVLNASASVIWLSLPDVAPDRSGLADLVRARTSPALDDATVEATVAQLVAEGLLSDRPA